MSDLQRLHCAMVERLDEASSWSIVVSGLGERSPATAGSLAAMASGSKLGFCANNKRQDELMMSDY
jgi:hypothetical protein